MAWKIDLYESASGQRIIEDFIASLQLSTQTKIARLFVLLTIFGPSLGMPHTKLLGKGLYELRIRGKQEVRIFYMFTTGSVIYVLHAFVKKSQVIPQRELALGRIRQTKRLTDL